MILKFSIPLDNRGGITYILLLICFDLFLLKNNNEMLEINFIISRWAFYIVILFIIYLHINLETSEFIYFQF
jgi:hypothetical protein